MVRVFFSHRPEGQRGGRTTEGGVPAGGRLGNGPPCGMQGHSGTRCCPFPPKRPSTFQVPSEEAGPGLPVTLPEADSRGNPGPLAVRGYTQLGAPEPALHRTGDQEMQRLAHGHQAGPARGEVEAAYEGLMPRAPGSQAACPGYSTSLMWTLDSLHEPNNPCGSRFPPLLCSLFPPLLCTPSLQG